MVPGARDTLTESDAGRADAPRSERPHPLFRGAEGWIDGGGTGAWGRTGIPETCQRTRLRPSRLA
jgi:hypothetical protein